MTKEELKYHLNHRHYPDCKCLPYSLKLAQLYLHDKFVLAEKDLSFFELELDDVKAKLQIEASEAVSI